MAKRVGLDGLADAIADILEEYETEVERGTVECVKEVTKAGAKALRETSPRDSGVYASGWTSKVTESNTGANGVIYNAKKPQLAHLLEKGHVTRNGTGRTFRPTPAHVHIKPVEDELVKDFENRVKVVIEG